MVSQENSPSAFLRALLPKSKMDTEAVEAITQLDAYTVKPLIPYLLEWLQDANWPVAQPVVELLRKYPSISVLPVRKILRNEAGAKADGEWKHNCLTFLVADMNREHKMLLKEELLRMFKSPTPDEKDWEIADVAKEILVEMDVAFEVDGEHRTVMN